MKHPLVTIAISIYNAEKYLDFAIMSTLNQSFKDFELLLINDGSTDGSLAIMEKYISDSRVTIINDNLNKGLIFRLNQSIELARGKYYARMDADDIMHPERLAKQVSYMVDHPEIDVLGTSCYILDKDNWIVGYRDSINRKWDKSSLIKGTPFCHPTVMGKLEWFKINKYNNDWLRAEDYELWLRASSESKYYNLEEKLLYYRESGIPSYFKYIKSLNTGFGLWANSDKLGITKALALVQIIKIVFKIFIYTIFYIGGGTDFFVKRRFSHLEIPIRISN